MPVFGGIEAGGTKFICIIGSGPGDIKAETRIPTTRPDETLDQAFRFFNEYQNEETLDGIGIASFGPVDPDPVSETFGFITTTVKPGWAYTDIVGKTKQALGIPVGFDTDVNAAALGEYIWGAGQGMDVLIYLTVGTGIGGGCLIDGKPLHGVRTPDVGHIRIPHNWDKDPYPGFCKVHGDCFQGLAAGPAIEGRWGIPGGKLTPDHPAWKLEVEYLSLGILNIIGILAPRRIIMGGGVMQQEFLMPMIRNEVAKQLRGYWEIPLILDNIGAYIVPPGLGNRSGSLGAIELARMAGAKSVGLADKN
jgi:fructokinase